MDERLGTALAVVIGIPGVLVGYIYLTELALRLAPDRRRSAIRPWLWLLPALLFLFFFLIFPTILTVLRSFQGAIAGTWVGLENYGWFIGSPDALVALRNSILWVVFLTLFMLLETHHVEGLVRQNKVDWAAHERARDRLGFILIPSFVVGLTAPFIAWLYARRLVSAGPVIFWNVFGMVVLANVVLIGFLSAPRLLN